MAAGRDADDNFPRHQDAWHKCVQFRPTLRQSFDRLQRQASGRSAQVLPRKDDPVAAFWDERVQLQILDVDELALERHTHISQVHVALAA